MKKIMLVGHTGAGKTTFRQAIYGQAMEYQKTQAVEVVNSTIDTPGEYLENRNLYRALIVTAADADLMVLLQDCTDEQAGRLLLHRGGGSAEPGEQDQQPDGGGRDAPEAGQRGAPRQGQ